MTKAEKKENDIIAENGCMICNRMGTGMVTACIHHVRRCGGKRKLAPKIGLCAFHHQNGSHAIHRGRLSFEFHYGVSEYQLVEETERLLLSHGLTPTWRK